MKYSVLRFYFYQGLQLLSLNNGIVKKKAKSEKRGKVESKNSNSSDIRLKNRLQETHGGLLSSAAYSLILVVWGSWLQPWLASAKDPGWQWSSWWSFQPTSSARSRPPVTRRCSRVLPRSRMLLLLSFFFFFPLVIISFTSTFSSFSSHII